MYGASNAAFENLVLAYGDEVENTSTVRVAIVDPGATRTTMRERAFPGENPETLKSPDVVGERNAELATAGLVKIERASRRETVCQRVSYTVLVVALKKHQAQNNIRYITQSSTRTLFS